MEYTCGKLGDCIVSAVLALLCGQADIESHTNAAKRLTPATVGLSNQHVLEEFIDK